VRRGRSAEIVCTMIEFVTYITEIVTYMIQIRDTHMTPSEAWRIWKDVLQDDRVRGTDNRIRDMHNTSL